MPVCNTHVCVVVHVFVIAVVEIRLFMNSNRHPNTVSDLELSYVGTILIYSLYIICIFHGNGFV
jgi:hypothetical protein